MPEIRIILDVVGSRMTDQEIIAVRTGIEALGAVMKCGESELTCLPLMRLQFQLDKNGKETRKH
jgi:hypothetical protein